MDQKRLDKKQLIDTIVANLSQELAVLLKSAQAAHEAATHAESRSEGPYDTRGLEASYLAGAQAERAAALQRMIAIYKFLPTEIIARDVIGAGSLVELRSGPRQFWVLLMSQGGGTTVTFEGVSVQVLSLNSPLGEELDGRQAGEEFEFESPTGMRTYQILSVSA